ncbi:hypothetical protein PVL29_015498 [Vitis rotundifolia]|uniref:Micronuclear linker histone polyprotein-like protein n=1 Tax=Vitis rotundifolia TaxID=103349 RepID=A0AA38ZE09_VITRO|nr:hypothetical protein PVL29_015498 [Vitis rotundifolia]
MLILAFGAAVLGVMVINKLRDRRIFNLLVKEKDRQLISLQLHLQKERESTKEERWKIEELKAKILSLKSQNIELHSRVMEMQSTIASLRDEHKTLEMAFDEKQTEVKMLQERETDSIKENPEAIALKEILKQREAEIEDLKQHLKSLVNVRSVSTDDPSNPPVNLTARENIGWENKTKAREGKEQNEHLHEADSNGNGQKLTGGDGSENGVGVNLQKEMTGEAKFQKFENTQDNVRDGGITGEKGINADQGNKNKHSQDELDFGTREKKADPNATEAIFKSEVGKTIDEDGNIKVMDNKEHGIIRNGHLEKHENSQDGESQKLGMISKRGVKMEMPGNSMNGAGKQGHAGKTKEKRWRILTKSRGVENNGNSENSRAATTRRRRFSKDKRGNIHSTPDVAVPTSRISSEAGNIAGSARKLGKEVGEDRKRDGGDIQQETGTRDFHEAAENTEQAKVAEADKEPEDLEIADIHQQETKAANGYTFRDNFENNKEGYKDETDEPEF